MTNTNLQKTLKFIFLPALLLSVFLTGSSTLFHLAQNSLLGNQLGFDLIPALQVSSLLPQIILALSVLIFSNKKPFEKAFRGTLIALTAVITVVTVLLYFQGNLALQGASETLGIFKPFVTNWPMSLMYIALSLVKFNLYTLFIWGFINRLASLSEGVKYYLPLALVLGIAGPAIAYPLTMVFGAVQGPCIALAIPAIILMVCALFIFNWSWKRLPDSLIHLKDASPVAQIRFPLLSAAYLLAGCVMVKSLVDILFKTHLKAHTNGATYSQFMANYSMTAGYSTLVLSIIWAGLGTWLLVKKGWKTTALYASISIPIGGVILLALSSSWLNQGIFTGLLISTSTSLLFPLIQVAYLYLPYQNRFKTKIATEMIALPVMKALPSMVVQGLTVTFGSMAAVTIYLKVLIPILMALLIIASIRAGARFPKTKTT